MDVFHQTLQIFPPLAKICLAWIVIVALSVQDKQIRMEVSLPAPENVSAPDSVVPPVLLVLRLQLLLPEVRECIVVRGGRLWRWSWQMELGKLSVVLWGFPEMPVSLTLLWTMPSLAERSTTLLRDLPVIVLPNVMVLSSRVVPKFHVMVPVSA